MKFALLLTMVFPIFSDVRFTHRTDDFATHQPVLYEVAMRTTGPIIEFGCGNGSTDLLHEVCKRTGRILITVEDDLAWMMKFATKYLGDGYEVDNSGWHKFYFVSGKHDHSDPSHWVDFLEREEFLQTTDFSLCFVDQDPWLARYETILRMKDKAKFIILHDCDYFPTNGIFGSVIHPHNSRKQRDGSYDFGDMFRVSKVYYPSKPWPANSGPPTLLGSNFAVELPEIDYANY